VIHKTARIHPTAVIGSDCIIGKNVVIREFCSVGSSGFIFPRDSDGNLHHTPSSGRVVIEDNVELFPYVSIDLGTEGDTRIGEGTKIDHYCRIAHNCDIGRHCVIASSVVFGGHCALGDYSYVGMGAVIKNFISVGSDCLVGMGAVVTKDIEDGCLVYGVPARVMGENERGFLYKSRLDEMMIKEGYVER